MRTKKGALSFLGMGLALSAFAFLLAWPAPALSQIEFELKDMSIVANDGIQIEGAWDQLGGHICTRNGPIVLGGKLSTRFNLANTMVANPGGAVILENFARIGDVCADSVVVNGTAGVQFTGTQYDPAVQGCQCPPDPPQPSFDVSFDPGDDIICTQGGTNIVPGTYRDLIVEFRGVCNFIGPGDYNFRSVNADTNSSYEFNFVEGACSGENGFNLNVKQFFYAGEYGFFNTDNVPSVFLFVEGADGDWSQRTFKDNKFISPFTSTFPAFGYRGDGNFNACYVFAPNGTVAVKGKADTPFNAVWIGKYFWEWLTLRVTTQNPGYFEDCCQKRFICFSIYTFAETEVCPGETITIIGEGFNSSTVPAVLFFPVGGSIADISDPSASATCQQAVINFIDSATMQVQVPEACGPGDYYIGVVNDSLVVNLVGVLTILECP